MNWYDYRDRHPHNTVTGTLKVYEALHSPQLGNNRDIFVALPPGYDDTHRRYPVVYTHDGQNLFDQHTSYAGEWQVDETLHTLHGEGLDAIVVGLPNMGNDRIKEYSPFRSYRWGEGRADDYLRFIVHTVKPLVDQSFRTQPDREHTGIMGSSMGGLVSLYGFFRFCDWFGFAGVMSPSLWFDGGAIFPFVLQSKHCSGMIYLDMGGRESPTGQGGMNYGLRNARRMQKLLQSKGYRADQNLLYVEDMEAGHTESAWAYRLPNALRFLLRPQPMHANLRLSIASS